MFSFFRKKRVDPRAALVKTLGDSDLPSFPTVILRTLKLIRDPQSSAASIAEVLSADPGLLVSVLRIANSAAFSSSNKVENLTQAIAIVGMSQLESMVLAVGVGKLLPNIQRPGFDSKRFWRTSAKRGMLSLELAKAICPAKQSECFTAGFLQDMAIPLLVSHQPESYLPLLEKWHSGIGTLHEMEQEAFGWDHAEVATWLCSEWELPEAIASEIGGHHQNDEGIYDCSPPVRLVSQLTENEQDSGLDPLRDQLQTQFQFEEAKTDQIIELSFQGADDLSKMMT